MSWLTLAWFIPACFALNMTPGPNNLMALNNAKRYGWSHACLAGLGRLSAFAVMITLAASGLATLLYASELFFTLLKVLGALYASAGRLLDKGLGKPSWQRAFNRLCATLLGSAGLGLLLSKRLPA